MLVVILVGLVAGGLVVGSRLVAGCRCRHAAGRGRRRLLDGIDVMLAGLFILSAIVVTRPRGWSAPVMPDWRVVWLAGHVMAVSVWLGALLPTVLFLRGAAPTDGRHIPRTQPRRAAGLVVRALRARNRGRDWCGGFPERGRIGGAHWHTVWPLLLLQAVLFAYALGLMVVALCPTAASSRTPGVVCSPTRGGAVMASVR